MKYKYSVSKDDLISFYQYQSDNNIKVQRFISISRNKHLFLTVVLAFMATYRTNDIPLLITIGFGIYAVLRLLLYGSYYNIKIKKAFNDKANEIGIKNNLIGEHEIYFKKSSITIKNKTYEIEYIRPFIIKVILNKNTIYLFVNNDSSYIIPINDKKYEQIIIKKVKKYIITEAVQQAAGAVK